jgi:hypothetical protein
MGDGCPIKQLCYRFTAEIEGRQDFFGSLPFNEGDNDCTFFWIDTVRNQQIRLIAHKIWENSGRKHGEDLKHWQQAEKEFLTGFI